MGCKKQGAKNRVIIIQKEKRQPGSQTNPCRLTGPLCESWIIESTIIPRFAVFFYQNVGNSKTQTLITNSDLNQYSQITGNYNTNKYYSAHYTQSANVLWDRQQPMSPAYDFVPGSYSSYGKNNYRYSNAPTLYNSYHCKD